MISVSSEWGGELCCVGVGMVEGVRCFGCVWVMLKEWSGVLFRIVRCYGGMFVVLQVAFTYADGLAAFTRRMYMFHRQYT